MIELEIEAKVKIFLDYFPFHKSKINAVLEPKTGNFWGVIGFEVKAKNLSFEAKDLKMCSRQLLLMRNITSFRFFYAIFLDLSF